MRRSELGPAWEVFTPDTWIHKGLRTARIAATVRRRQSEYGQVLGWTWAVHEADGDTGFHATGSAKSGGAATEAAIAAGALARGLRTGQGVEAELLERVRALEAEIERYEAQALVLRNTVASARLSDLGDTAILDVVVESLRDGPSAPLVTHERERRLPTR
jgi:hypothetical protein